MPSPTLFLFPTIGAIRKVDESNYENDGLQAMLASKQAIDAEGVLFLLTVNLYQKVGSDFVDKLTALNRIRHTVSSHTRGGSSPAATIRPGCFFVYHDLT